MKKNIETHPDTKNQEHRRMAYLIAGFVNETLNRAEHDELNGWRAGNPDHEFLFAELTNPFYLQKMRRPSTVEEKLKQFDESILEATAPLDLLQEAKYVYLIAAAVFLLTIFGLYVCTR